LTLELDSHNPDVGEIDEQALGRLVTAERFRLWEEAARAERVPLADFIADSLDRAASVILGEGRSGGTGTN
jgi:hypothetical protein